MINTNILSNFADFRYIHVSGIWTKVSQEKDPSPYHIFYLLCHLRYSQKHSFSTISSLLLYRTSGPALVRHYCHVRGRRAKDKQVAVLTLTNNANWVGSSCQRLAFIQNSQGRPRWIPTEVTYLFNLLIINIYKIHLINKWTIK